MGLTLSYRRYIVRNSLQGIGGDGYHSTNMVTPGTTFYKDVESGTKSRRTVPSIDELVPTKSFSMGVFGSSRANF